VIKDGNEMSKPKLFGMTLTELQQVSEQAGLPKYAAKQIAAWLYRSEAKEIEDMTNISKQARKYLSENFQMGLELPEHVDVSSDGTKKYLFPAENEKFIEAAYIPEPKRKTLCISSQVGCKMGCLFCMTARMGFHGNLDAAAILNQIRSIPESSELTNIVYMGMGEPMDNLEQVLKSLEILTSDWGFQMSPKRITVSTIGILPAMKEFLARSKAQLAVSLHNPFDKERQELMPVQQVYPMKQIMDELRHDRPDKLRKLSFEYILFEGVNDTPRHAKELVRLIHGVKARVNLIHFHPIPGTPLTGSSDENTLKFQRILKEKGVITTIRRSRGEDIQAACGLLSTKELIKKEENSDY
jgi:23S rRNA (adenine2503-C2)-methyltransferase